MLDILYGLFEVLIALTGLGNKTTTDAKLELKELFGDTTRKDKVLLAIVLSLLAIIPILIMIAAYLLSD